MIEKISWKMVVNHLHLRLEIRIAPPPSSNIILQSMIILRERHAMATVNQLIAQVPVDAWRIAFAKGNVDGDQFRIRSLECTDAGEDPESAAPGYPDLMVVYDDLDLPAAQLRIRPHGGTGGHNGVRSITEHLSTDLFPRLKVGIGREGTDAARYVLQPFSASQREEIEVAYPQAAEALLDWLAHGDLEACMTRFHSRWNEDS